MKFRKSKAVVSVLGLGLMVGMFAAGGSTALAATTPTTHSHAALALRAGNNSSARPELHLAAGNGEKVCLENASSFCADVKGNSNTSGTAIWLENDGTDDLWDVVAYPDCVAGVCYYVKDAQDTALCLAATGNEGAHVGLEPCNDSGAWYNNGDYLVGNAEFGESGSLYANADGNGYYLYAGANGPWQRWTFGGGEL